MVGAGESILVTSISGPIRGESTIHMHLRRHQMTVAGLSFSGYVYLICFATSFGIIKAILYQYIYVTVVNPLKGRGSYIATSNNMKLVHWPLMGGTARRGLGGLGPRPVPSSLYQM